MRCGACCAKGGPALHGEDLALVRDGVLEPGHLFTLRAGETVHDQPSGGYATLQEEVVKVRGPRGPSPCMFYAPETRGCGIYDDRPAECRALLCSNPEPLMRIYAVDRLSREDILGSGHPLTDLITAHEAGCPVLPCLALAKRFASGHKDALDEMARMVRFDAEMRGMCIKRAGLSRRETDFVLGRPLAELMEQEGVRARIPESGAIGFSIAPGRRT